MLDRFLYFFFFIYRYLLGFEDEGRLGLLGCWSEDLVLARTEDLVLARTEELVSVCMELAYLVVSATSSFMQKISSFFLYLVASSSVNWDEFPPIKTVPTQEYQSQNLIHWSCLLFLGHFTHFVYFVWYFKHEFQAQGFFQIFAFVMEYCWCTAPINCWNIRRNH